MDRSKFESLQTYFPIVAEKVVDYYDNGLCELVLTMENGDRVSYDSVEKTIRRLPTDASNMTEDEICEEFVIRLRQHLRARGMTQQDLSEETGISQTLLSRYMTGKTTPSFHVVDKIARAIGCRMDDLRYYK